MSSIDTTSSITYCSSPIRSNEIISFQDSNNITTDDDDGWVEFSLSTAGGGGSSGIHALYMCYAPSRYSNPCRLRIDGKVMPVCVACRISDNDETQQQQQQQQPPRWFDDHEGYFDLGSKKKKEVKVAFKSVTGIWPNITAFRFVPEQQQQQWGQQQQQQQHYITGRGRIIESSHDDDGARWSNHEHAAVTFTFEIGIASSVLAEQQEDDEDVEYVTPYLGGKAIKFVFGEAHDCITIDGDPMGNQEGGDNFPQVTFVDTDDVISSVTMGLSSWNGEAAFYGLTLEKKKKRKKKQRRRCGNDEETHQHYFQFKRPLVGANLLEPTWTYDRRRIGLQLWITSLAAPKHRPVSRYGFTLSSDEELTFDESEFERFWEWLIQIKCNMVLQNNREAYNCSAALRESSIIRTQMEPLHDFLLSSFSCRPAKKKPSLEGYLYGTNRHVSITFDVFSIYVYRLPDGENFQSILFVDGRQYDTQERSRIEQLNLTRNDILAFAILVGLKDTDLLYQMGLIRPQGRDETDVSEIELLPLRKDGALFQGNFDNTVMARRAVTILAVTGLRRVNIDVILEDEDGWDIYDIAAGTSSIYGRFAYRRIQLASVVCGLLQVIVPILLIYRGCTRPTEDLTWDVYIARLFFGVYAIFYEAKTWDVDNGDRVTGWLCFLPEFDTRKLILGMLINKISMVVVDVAIIILMLRSYTVFDVTLNALALYFILEVDDNLVDDGDMEMIRRYEKQKLFSIKSKTTLEYQTGWFQETDLPKIEYLPARYFVVASHRVSTMAIALLFLGCIWMIVEPFVLGWEVEE